MSTLDHIADQVRKEGRAEAQWLMLRNVYFRDGNGWDALESWAKAQGLRYITSEQLGQNGKPTIAVQFYKLNALYPAAPPDDFRRPDGRRRRE